MVVRLIILVRYWNIVYFCLFISLYSEINSYSLFRFVFVFLLWMYALCVSWSAMLHGIWGGGVRELQHYAARCLRMCRRLGRLLMRTVWRGCSGGGVSAVEQSCRRPCQCGTVVQGYSPLQSRRRRIGERVGAERLGGATWQTEVPVAAAGRRHRAGPEDRSDCTVLHHPDIAEHEPLLSDLYCPSEPYKGRTPGWRVRSASGKCHV